MRIRQLLVATVFGFGIWVVACSDQGEGARCDSRFGDSDCKDGLECKTAASLGGLFDLCCPRNGGGTVPECRGAAGLDGGTDPNGLLDSSADADSATTPDASTDATNDASDGESTSDATSDVNPG